MSSALDSKPNFASNEERVPQSKEHRNRIMGRVDPKTFSDSTHPFSAAPTRRKNRFQSDFVGIGPGDEFAKERLINRLPPSHQNVKYEDDNVRFLATGSRLRPSTPYDRVPRMFELSTQRIQRLNTFPDGTPRSGFPADLSQEQLMQSELGNAVTDLTSILKQGIPQQGALSVDDYKKLLAGQFQSPGVQSVIFNQEQQKIAAALALAGIPANVAAAIAPGFAGLPANLAAAIAPLIPAPVAGGGGPAPAPAPVVAPPVPFSSLDAATRKSLIESKFDELIKNNKKDIIDEINKQKLATQKIIDDDYKGDMSKVPAELKKIQEKINKFDEVKFEKNVKGLTAVGAKLSSTNKNALNALSALLISRLNDPEKTGYLSPTSTASSSPAGSPAGSRRGSAAAAAPASAAAAPASATTPAAALSPGAAAAASINFDEKDFKSLKKDLENAGKLDVVSEQISNIFDSLINKEQIKELLGNQKGQDLVLKQLEVVAKGFDYDLEDIFNEFDNTSVINVEESSKVKDLPTLRLYWKYLKDSSKMLTPEEAEEAAQAVRSISINTGRSSKKQQKENIKQKWGSWGYFRYIQMKNREPSKSIIDAIGAALDKKINSKSTAYEAAVEKIVSA